MKKYIDIGILFIFFWNIPVCLGQDYHFDKLVQYKGIFSDGEKYKTTFCFNSKDSSYYLVIFDRYQFSFILLNNKKKQEGHYYEYGDLTKSKDILYMHSRKFGSNGEDSDCTKCSAQEIELDSLTSKITFKILGGLGEKKCAEIKVKKVDYFVPTIGLDLADYLCFSCSKSTISRFKLPTSLTITSDSQVTHKEKLILEQNIDIDFQVDEKNIKYEN